VPEPLSLRHQGPATTLVLIRLGARTLDDDRLADQCERTRGRWGFDGFSVFEVPAGDYALLARLVPIVALRPKLYRAEGAALLDAGFPLFPTGDFPHWTVVLSRAARAQFTKVRAQFVGPLDNPAWDGRR
jgi:hypothetical protein